MDGGGDLTQTLTVTVIPIIYINWVFLKRPVGDFKLKPPKPQKRKKLRMLRKFGKFVETSLLDFAAF